MILRFIGYLFGIGAVLFLAAAGAVAWYVSGITQDLPNYDVLAKYEPPVMTRVHAADGQLVAEYAAEKRLYLPIQAIPDQIKNAFISAEDKNFYEHAGLDYQGIARAFLTNLESYGKGNRLVGASTITQQVARNFLLTLDQTWDRKIKEAILSLRIEQAYSKEKILELYLNEIFLGLGSYGVASAALTYFDKSVHELTLAETAYLAALPKGPNNYNPFKYPDRALERRNWVIDRMVENGYASAADGEKAKKEPLGVKLRDTGPTIFAADYFVEEVRRQLSSMFGEKTLYEGGLSVRTSLVPSMQVMARQALVDGLSAYDTTLGWRGAVSHIEDMSGDWGPKVGAVTPLSDLTDWRLAVVLNVSPDQAEIGLRPDLQTGTNKVTDDRTTGTIAFKGSKWKQLAAANGSKKGTAVKSMTDLLQVGDVVYVSASSSGGGAYDLRQVPQVEGALVAMDPHTGRVLAMVGGFSYAESQFNRATQAYRQPGSSFKPFVYSAALDNGYTPSSVIMDAPIEIDQGNGLGMWRPENYSGEYYGPSTLRTGIELSRNVMTVRLAQDMGMPLIAEYGRRFGVYDNLQPVLSMALGAGETTVLRMTAGYAVFANGGKEVRPTLIDRIQNRYGQTIFKHEDRLCEGCDADSWHGQDEPQVVDNAEQVLDPMTAFQMTSMLEGVVQRGTGTSAKAIGKPVAGKTGTTNDYNDAWFVGYSPDLVCGVWVGYDTPRSLGEGETGGSLAAPVFTEFMQQALADKPPIPFRVPPGMNFIPIDRHTGLRAEAGDPGTILEAFKPGTAPPDTYSIIGYTDTMGRPLTVAPESDRAVISGTGGLY
jgi:penicillin-binding protein 1A